MFRDCDGSELAIGDDVTVQAFSRHALAGGSYGTIEKFGRKLAHVRLTWAHFERDDGALLGFPPGELRKGRHGRPRHPQGPFGEFRESLETYRSTGFDKLIKLAVERGVITAAQGEVMKSFYDEVEG